MIKTKFGNATLNPTGYYRITSAKEGNCGKLLHRLLFEEFYNINLNEEFPEGIVIHHLNGDKTCNEIWNLVPMTNEEHTSFHHKGMKHTEESKKKMRINHAGNTGKEFTLDHKRKLSASRNKLGYFNVCIQPCSSCKQGFRYKYSYFEDGKQKVIQNVSLEKLKERVLAKGLHWEKFTEVA